MSDTMKHTAGPWRFDADLNEIQAGEETLIAYPATSGGSLFDRSSLAIPEPDETRANGRLIAAAPDLLQACHLILAIHENPSQQIEPLRLDPQAEKQLRAAISKATGETR